MREIDGLTIYCR